MKINHPKSGVEYVRFESLSMGDCFVISSHAFIKTQVGFDYNCVALLDGRAFVLRGDARVTPIAAELSYKYVDSAAK